MMANAALDRIKSDMRRPDMENNTTGPPHNYSSKAANERSVLNRGYLLQAIEKAMKNMLATVVRNTGDVSTGRVP